MFVHRASTGDQSSQMRNIDRVYNAASDSAAQIAKVKLGVWSEHLGLDPSDVCRSEAYAETKRTDSDIQILV